MDRNLWIDLQVLNGSRFLWEGEKRKKDPAWHLCANNTKCKVAFMDLTLYTILILQLKVRSQMAAKTKMHMPEDQPLSATDPSVFPAVAVSNSQVLKLVERDEPWSPYQFVLCVTIWCRRIPWGRREDIPSKPFKDTDICGYYVHYLCKTPLGLIYL